MDPIMGMSEIRSAVVAALQEAQAKSGKAYADLSGDDQPIGNLDGFDSLMGIEVTVIIEERMGCQVDRDSLFVAEDGRRAATLQEVCDYIADLAPSDERTEA